ncbi:MAG: aspartate 1-decarboxylase [Candidatus Micrarchaeota archaeon]|nr:aspartate 1-decarboxylase [Candidatus Micrarchaeota archaeon]
MRILCKSKIHRATVTGLNKDYIGSIGIDADLIEKADIWAGEKALVVNLSNGERWETYVGPLEKGSGKIELYGGGALKGKQGDLLIILAFAVTDEKIKPKIVLVDKNNKFKEYL